MDSKELLLTDNPYLVFESLNHKGKPLSVADLIRNYVFMNIHVDHQEDIYNDIWKPMQDRLGDTIPEFVRHYLTMNGDYINTGDVYNVLKERIDRIGVEDCLEELNKFSKFYSIFINPENEDNEKIRKELYVLKRLDISTSYPLLLNIYNIYEEGNITVDEFEEMLCVVENYIVRRFVCGVPTNQLNKVFPQVFIQMKKVKKNYILIN